jgi:hypothetical protein
MAVECARCKAQNADGNKFCGDCGAPLDPAAAAAKAAANSALRGQVQEIIEQHYKDQKVVEIETTQAIASRLLDWAKLFGFFVAIPAAILLLILSVLGINTYSDFTKQVNLARTDATTQLKAAQTGAEKLKSEVDAFEKEYAALRARLPEIAAVQEELKGLSNRVADLEKIGFTPTSKISAESKTQLQRNMSRFQDYLKGLGYRGTAVSIDFDIRQKIDDPGKIAYYDPGKQLMVIDSGYAADTAVFYREYMHHVLNLVGIRKFSEIVPPSFIALESGLAWYFPCSFMDNPTPAKHATSWDLTKKRSFTELRPDRNSAEIDGAEIWGGAFWELRQILGKSVADKLLYDAWFRLMAENTITNPAAGFVDKLLDLDKVNQEKIRAVFTRRGFSF